MAPKGIRVLVVEDELITGYHIKTAIEDMGHTVIGLLDSGEKAVRCALEERPDIILMDIVLKGDMDGIEAAERIHRAADIPVVFLTAYSDRATMDRAAASHPYGYIFKPVNERDIYINLEIAYHKHAVDSLLRENESFLLTTLISIGEGIIVADLDGRITLMNPAAESITGWTRDEARGRRLDEVFKIHNEILERIRAGDPSLRYEDIISGSKDFFLTARDGARTPVEFNTASISGEMSRTHGAVIVFRDIRERRNTERELERYREHLEDLVRERSGELLIAKEQAEAANLAKSEFLANVSHELRTPLSSILGFSKLMKMGYDPHEYNRSLDNIISSGQHLLNIINDILDLSKIEAGKMSCDSSVIGLGSVLGECVSQLSVQAGNRGISISYEKRHDEEARVNGDRKRLNQVFINLISNAIKYTGEGGRILVSSAIEEDRVRIDVADNGIGIAEEYLDRIFDSFVRVESGLSRESEGTGLGLAITKKIVEAHGGTIEVQSSPGEGSNFIVRLPLARGGEGIPPLLQEEARSYPARAKTKKILVVDDDEKCRDVLSSYFRINGQRCLIARDGMDAMEILEGEDVALVFMDIRMSGLGGVEAMRRIKSRWEIPVVAVTAQAMPGTSEELLEKGFDAFLPKPVDFNVLSLTISRLIG